MMRMMRAARGGAALAVLMASAACSSTNGGGLGGILGSVLGGVGGGGGGGSRVTGTIQGVNTRNRQIGLTQSNGQTVSLNYDNNTQVVYQNQNYSVTNLEYGDRVTARITNSNNNSGGYYTDLIQVDQSASTNNGGINNGNNNVQQFEGTVRQVDRTNGLFTISSRNNNGTLTVQMPYNPRQTDVNRFNGLRAGDYVRIYGQLLNNNRVQFSQFY